MIGGARTYEVSPVARSAERVPCASEMAPSVTRLTEAASAVSVWDPYQRRSTLGRGSLSGVDVLAAAARTGVEACSVVTPFAASNGVVCA